MKNLLMLAPAVWLMAFPASAAEKAAEPAYNTATVIEVSATVSDVREVSKDQPLSGVHVTLQSGGETLDVYVGPIEFVNACEFTFEKGNKIRVIGSRVTFGGSAVLLAREVTREKVTLLIRDKAGEPLWKFFIRPQG